MSAVSGNADVTPPIPVGPSQGVDLETTAPSSPEVGWHVDPEHLSEQVYWDGQSWVARRRWSGTSWTEVPVDR